MTTPFMSLTLPDVQVTASPTWAQELNDALTAIDSHTHVAGDGARITVAALKINDNLSLSSYGLSSVGYATYVNQTGDTSNSNSIYVKNGELYYKDASANIVQMTSGGSVNSATGSFTGLSSPAAATYSSVNKLFTWTYNSNKFSRMANADVQLYPYDASTAYTKAITVKAPTGLESLASYSFILPDAKPGSGVEWLNMDSTGQLDTATLSGTSHQINVSANATSIVLSTPQSIDTTSTVTFAGVTSNYSANASGSVGNPIYTVVGDSNTGLYFPAADALSVTAGGVEQARFTANSVRAPDGALTAPSFSFLTDSTTGIYKSGTATLAVTAGNFKALEVGDHITSVFSATALRNVDGTAAFPSYSFTSDTNTGMYSSAADEIGFAVAGARKFKINSTYVAVKDTLQSAGNPVYTFVDDIQSGIYYPGGNERFGVSVNQTPVMKGVYDGTYYMLSSSNYMTFGEDTANRYKVKVYTGTLAASSSVTLTPLVSGVVLGFNGRTDISSLSTAQAVIGSSSATDRIYALNTTRDRVTLTNGYSGGPNVYSIVVYYRDAL